MSGINGKGPAPLHLTNPQRAAYLAKMGLNGGWVLLSLAEMHEMKRLMDGATAENARLNQQSAKLISSWIADQWRAKCALERMEKFCAGLAERTDLPMAITQDALTELAAIRPDLAHFTPKDAGATPQKKEETHG